MVEKDETRSAWGMTSELNVYLNAVWKVVFIPLKVR